MFVLTKITDLVRIEPHEFRKPSFLAIKDKINSKFSNKVIQGIGLCICVWDISECGEGLISTGEGLVNVTVVFRLVVFRPEINEIFYAKITGSSAEGIHLRTDFFRDILVPHQYLPHKSIYDPNNKVWEWMPQDEGEDGDVEPHDTLMGDENKLYFDKHEIVRVQVMDEKWCDQMPDAPPEQDDPDDPKPKLKAAPYTIIGSMNSAGLGCCIWWDQPDGEGEAE